ncbi:MAG: hypothetical protein NZ920_02480 [Aigarchaeota archaeon]|nr:hypothetical protein [Aigarchaeota archaeon]MDW8092509.1 hypothetical protein [Nitrososphaerota archaeon]
MRGLESVKRVLRISSNPRYGGGGDVGAFKTKLNYILTGLSSYIHRLDVKYKELEVRGKEYFENCVNALKSNDRERAVLYASEIAELRKIAKIILHILLMLEQVKIRVETVMELSEMFGLISTLKGLISKVMGEMQRIAPETANQLSDLSRQIDELVTMSNVGKVGEPMNVELSDEAAKIVEEAKIVAAEMLERSFPEAPLLNDVERRVYDFISSVKQSGDLSIDVDILAENLNLPQEKVEEALSSLERKGIIELAESENA